LNTLKRAKPFPTSRTETGKIIPAEAVAALEKAAEAENQHNVSR
jgi:hypothetical protein